ncbi:hypothetical protein Trydic_g9700 [Trypoxylus dichotomus]
MNKYLGGILVMCFLCIYIESRPSPENAVQENNGDFLADSPDSDAGDSEDSNTEFTLMQGRRIIVRKMRLLPLLIVLVPIFVTLVHSKPSVEEKSQQGRVDSSSVVKGEEESSTPKIFLSKDTPMISPRLALYFKKCEPGYRVDRTGRCRKVYDKKYANYFQIALNKKQVTSSSRQGKMVPRNFIRVGPNCPPGSKLTRTGHCRMIQRRRLRQ